MAVAREFEDGRWRDRYTDEDGGQCSLRAKRARRAGTAGPPVAWQGKDAANNTFVLYQKQWPNPLPDVQIDSIDLVSTMTTAAPFLVALTAQ